MRFQRLTDSERQFIVNLRFQLQFSLRSIAHIADCHHSTVSRVCSQYATTGSSRRNRPIGNAPVLNRRQLAALKRAIKREPDSTSYELATWIHSHFDVSLTPRAVRLIRRSMMRPTPERLIQGLSRNNQIKRMEFCTTHEHATFRNVMFSDEKIWRLDRTANTVWVEPGQAAPVREIQNHKTSIMVWGCIWYDGRSEIAIVDGNINSTKYTDILASHLLPIMPTHAHYYFQQDNAAVHVSRHTNEWLSTWGVPMLENWPPYSPDLNPIERVWSWMDRFVKRKYPTNYTTLRAAIELAWQEIPQDVIRAFIDALPRVVERVRAAGGSNIY